MLNDNHTFSLIKSYTQHAHQNMNENMIVQVSKFIIVKRNIHLKEIEQYLKSLKSNINPELVQISKELIKECRNIITQNTMKKYS